MESWEQGELDCVSGPLRLLCTICDFETRRQVYQRCTVRLWKRIALRMTSIDPQQYKLKFRVIQQWSGYFRIRRSRFSHVIFKSAKAQVRSHFPDGSVNSNLTIALLDPRTGLSDCKRCVLPVAEKTPRRKEWRSPSSCFAWRLEWISRARSGPPDGGFERRESGTRARDRFRRTTLYGRTAYRFFFFV